MSFYLLVAATLLFFAFTRTRAGRAELQRQLEQQFAGTFDGRLEIGSLEGNVVYSLLATDVLLLAPDGSLVASIDSIRARPTWSGLLRRTLEFDRLDIRGTTATLEQDSSGAWNVARALRPRRFAPDSVASVDAPSLVLPRFSVQRASISVSSHAGRPKAVTDGYIFDFLDATYVVEDARVAMDWTTSSRQIDVIGLRARIEDPAIVLTDGTAQFVVGGDRFDITDLQLRTHGSSLEAVAALDFRPNPGRLHRKGRLRVDAVTLDPAELSGLFPLQPFRKPVGLKVDLSGSLDDFIVHDSEIAYANSRVGLTGLASAKGDTVTADIALRTDYLAILDLDALLPDRGIGGFFAVDSIIGDVFVQGSFARNNPERGDFTANVQSELRTGAGDVASTGLVRRRTGTVSYAANLSVADVDASAASGGRLPPSLLSGSAFLESTSIDPRQASGQFEILLANSFYDGIRIDSLTALASATRGVYTGSARLIQGSASIDGDATLDLAIARSGLEFEAHLDSRGANLGEFLRNDSIMTALNGMARLRWRKDDESAAGSATIVLNESDMSLGSYRQHLPESESTVMVTSDSDGGTISIDGDLLTASIESSRRLGELRSSIPRISALVSDHISRLAPTDFARALDRPLLSGITAYYPHADVSFTARLHADSTVASLLARQMVRVADVRIRFDLSSDVSGVSLFGEGSADSAATRTSSVKQPALRFAITIPSDTLAQVRGDLEANATLVANTTRVVANPTLRLELDGPTATASLAARESPTLGPVDILVSANRINGTWDASFDRFLTTASGYAVSVSGDHRVELYRDAVAIQTLSFLSPGPAGQRQTLDFHGTYSPSSADTLVVTANEVDLERLSAFAGLAKPFQGLASGRMEIVQVNAVPVLAGTVRVDRLGLDDRVLGDFAAVSSFSTRSNEVDVTATLSPAGGIADVAADVDDVLLTSVANDLTVTGAVRFSGSSSARSTGLDLTVDVRRVDMFFFEYVFPHTIDNVTGHLAGTGSIRGTLARPVFGANLTLPSGAFSVPEFNLNLGITADITVDADAIRIARATVTDGSGGTTDLSGDVLFNDYRYFSLDLSGDLQDFQIMNITHSNELPFYGNIRGSGLLTLSGPISGATLRAADAVTAAESEVYIPLVNAVAGSDDSFIVFADSTGFVSDPIETTRRNVLSTRPRGERSFLDGLELDLNIFAPQGSTVHLVIDPLVGDVINAVGTGRVQIRRRGGEFSTFGVLEVNSGDYLFTAGDVFVRQFNINSGGRITWDGDPTNAILDIPASYETRASRAGLPGSDGSGSAIPLIVRLRITGRVETPQVDLSLEVDRTNRDISGNYAALEAVLNQPSRSTEYATSVLVSNSFLLTTSDVGTEVLASSAFNSVSQLVSSQINRYLNEALPNVDFSFGVQGESTQELGVTYGVALRLLDERLVIRGQGVYQGARTEATDVSSQNLEGEFVVEIKLSPTVSVEVFYRREGDVLTNNATLTGSTGAGVSYSTEFSTWRQFFSRIFRTSSRSGGTSD